MELNIGGKLRKNHQKNSTFSSKIAHFRHKKHICTLPPAIKLCSFCPVFTGFFLVCVRYAHDETEFGYDKTMFEWVRTTN